ncbi:Riboflavin transporter [Roseovarius litorisediminis]|uniref:Riboflavin transporter n=1 Tax=Roseovarius litorisediminis TaxID=1312363 RepID=A0A1Y5RVI0_9RHOB|nr:DMT family transporter [Roseovarius litorisediminis]SLN26119.1 Riboflavin transporter [Roseovarius litorisediminis]
MTRQTTSHNSAAGIGIILIAMLAISFNDMLIKFLSGGYPLHQMVFTRSAIGICFSLILVQFEGGWGILKTKTPGLHLLRGVMIVVANMSFFAALAALPLAETTAIFFVAPLMITLLSIPVLGEKVGPLRIGAVIVGFVGVVIMTRPWHSGSEREAPLYVYLLPILSAFTYAANQVLTRKLGMVSKASALAVYVQAVFILVSLGFWAVAGDGRFVDGMDNPSLIFLLRAWVWPQGNDIYLFLGLGLNSAIIGYTLAQAYRMADAATVAPFEYAGLPLAIFWGWLIWGNLPSPVVFAGISLILGSGLFVFLRERQRNRPLVSRKRVHRRY